MGAERGVTSSLVKTRLPGNPGTGKVKARKRARKEEEEEEEEEEDYTTFSISSYAVNFKISNIYSQCVICKECTSVSQI
jgi:hypothetical protein